MRRTKLLVAAAFGTAIGAVTSIMGLSAVPAHALSSESGLVSWWKADGNALDSADGNNAALVNGASYGSGWVRQGFSFNNPTGTTPPSGSTPPQFVDIRDAANLDFGPSQSMSFSAWIDMMSTPAPFEHIFGRRAFDCSGNIGYQAFVYHDPNSGDNNIAFGGVPGEGGIGGNVPTNAWTHVAGTFDGATGTFVVYVNGVAVGTSPSGESLGGALTPPVDVRIGTSCENYPLNGLMDEVQIYNFALSADQVQGLAHNHRH